MVNNNKFQNAELKNKSPDALDLVKIWQASPI